MKKLLLSAVLATAFGAMAMAPTPAKAVDGVITVTGSVVAQTCTVDGNAFGTSDAVAVKLPLVLAPVLAGSGSVANKTGFSLVVAGCDSSLSTVQAFFSGANINTTDGNLKNATGAGNATNVEVQLLNGNSVVMPLNGATANAQNSLLTNLTGTTTKGATLNFFAQYFATGVATAGAVNTSVQFTMNYL